MPSPILLPSGAQVKQKSPAPPAVRSQRPMATSKVFLPMKGPPGSPGIPGSGAVVFGEEPIGVKDGVNSLFTTDVAFRLGSTAVCRNGLRELRGITYTEADDQTISFDTPPLSTDDITVDYVTQ